MKRFEIAEYRTAGCKQLERGNIMGGLVIHNLTDGRMCNGCCYFREGFCPAYRKLTAPVETVKEEATRLGISLSEVRRRRRENV